VTVQKQVHQEAPQANVNEWGAVREQDPYQAREKYLTYWFV